MHPRECIYTGVKSRRGVSRRDGMDSERDSDEALEMQSSLVSPGTSDGANLSSQPLQVTQMMRELAYQRTLHDILVRRRQSVTTGRLDTSFARTDYWTREAGTNE